MLSGGVPMSSLMGAIEEIYADIEADAEITETEFRERVEEKIEEMGGLVDEEMAAQLIAHDLAESDANTIADIDPEMSEVTFVGKVMAIDELRTFERDEEDTEGQVLNIECADETGRVRVALWNEKATAAERELETGQVLRINGQPKDGYNGTEVSANQAEPVSDADIDVDPAAGGGPTTVESLTLGQSDVILQGQVLATEPVRTFSRDDGSDGQVSNLVLGDETGRVRVTLWDEQADMVEDLTDGETIEIIDGYVRDNEGAVELHLGARGAIKGTDEDVTYTPEATPIESLEIGQTVDIAGVVRSTDPKRTFDRDDGSEGQVRNVRVQDKTGDIRVALWGEKADIDMGPGDEALFADVEIGDGWQDDIEASAGWQSTVSVLESDSAAGSRTSQTEPTTEENGQREGTLSSFTESTEKDTSSSNEQETEPAKAEGSTSDEELEFTGTVVQTGDPVMLDDGNETLTVETSEDVRLGEEITVRGRIEGDRLYADDVF